VSQNPRLGGTRRCYHRLVAEGLIPHTAATCRRLSSRLAQARREERFPDLADPLREVHVPSAWPDAGALNAGNPGENDLARGCPVTGGVVGALTGHGWGDLSG
jgi:hypothetical protein